MPWLILVQVKGEVGHPAYQVAASVRLKVPWASHGRQFTKNSVTPPLLLHQSCLTLAPPLASLRGSEAPSVSSHHHQAHHQQYGEYGCCEQSVLDVVLRGSGADANE